MFFVHFTLRTGFAISFIFTLRTGFISSLSSRTGFVISYVCCDDIAAASNDIFEEGGVVVVRVGVARYLLHIRTFALQYADKPTATA